MRRGPQTSILTAAPVYPSPCLSPYIPSTARQCASFISGGVWRSPLDPSAGLSGGRVSSRSGRTTERSAGVTVGRREGLRLHVRLMEPRDSDAESQRVCQSGCGTSMRRCQGCHSEPRRQPRDGFPCEVWRLKELSGPCWRALNFRDSVLAHRALMAGTAQLGLLANRWFLPLLTALCGVSLTSSSVQKCQMSHLLRCLFHIIIISGGVMRGGRGSRCWSEIL